MNKYKQHFTSIRNLLFLVIFWSLLLSALIFSARLVVALVFLINTDLFTFGVYDLLYSIRSGFASGTTAGIGIWIFSKIINIKK